MITVKPEDVLNSPMYWTDQANRYLQPGDYAYNRTELPWDKTDKTPARVGPILC